jgi:hypothetical protein
MIGKQNKKDESALCQPSLTSAGENGAVALGAGEKHDTGFPVGAGVGNAMPSCWLLLVIVVVSWWRGWERQDNSREM